MHIVGTHPHAKARFSRTAAETCLAGTPTPTALGKQACGKAVLKPLIAFLAASECDFLPSTPVLQTLRSRVAQLEGVGGSVLVTMQDAVYVHMVLSADFLMALQGPGAEPDATGDRDAADVGHRLSAQCSGARRKPGHR